MSVNKSLNKFKQNWLEENIIIIILTEKFEEYFNFRKNLAIFDFDMAENVHRYSAFSSMSTRRQ